MDKSWSKSEFRALFDSRTLKFNYVNAKVSSDLNMQDRQHDFSVESGCTCFNGCVNAETFGPSCLQRYIVLASYRVVCLSVFYMGNALAFCLLQTSVGIRVMKSNGEVLEFDDPIVTKQLMKAYPGHFVVHCSTISPNQLGRRSKVSVMRPEMALAKGETYCLLRVPDPGGDSRVLHSRPPNGMISNRSRNRKSGKIDRIRSSRSSSKPTSLQTLFSIHDLQNPNSSERVPYEVRQLQQQQSAIKAHQKQQGHKRPWRPALDVIAESPSCSSFRMSPLARQAAYIRASQTVVLLHGKFPRV